MKLYALDGKVFETIKVGADEDGCVSVDGCCCACRAPQGEDHAIGCDWEMCPRCGGQFIACNCDTDLKPGYSEGDVQEIVINLLTALWKKGGA